MKKILFLIIFSVSIYGQAASTLVNQAKLNDSTAVLRSVLATKTALSDTSATLRSSINTNETNIDGVKETLFGDVTSGRQSKIVGLESKSDTLDFIPLRIYNGTDSARLASFKTEIGITEKDLYFSEGTYDLGKSIVTDNINLKIAKGAKIEVASGDTLTIKGGIDAGLYQIFSGDGVVNLDSAKVTEVYPEWWGAVGFTFGEVPTVDDVVPLQKAINSYREIKLTKNYAISSGLNVTRSSTKIVGDKGLYWNPIITNIGGSNYNMITVSTSALKLEGVGINGNDSAKVNGIYMYPLQFGDNDSKFKDITVSQCDTAIICYGANFELNQSVLSSNVYGFFASTDSTISITKRTRNIILRGNRFHVNDSTDVILDDGLDGDFIYENVISENMFDGSNNGVKAVANSLTVSNNQFFRMFGTAIEVFFDKTIVGRVPFANVNNNMIVHYSASPAVGYSIYAHGGTSPLINLSIQNNITGSARLDAIKIVKCDFATINGNKIYNPQADTTKKTFSGIRVENSDFVLITNNAVRHTADTLLAGIYTDANSNYATVSNNLISGATTDEYLLHTDNTLMDYKNQRFIHATSFNLAKKATGLIPLTFQGYNSSSTYASYVRLSPVISGSTSGSESGYMKWEGKTVGSWTTLGILQNGYQALQLFRNSTGGLKIEMNSNNASGSPVAYGTIESGVASITTGGEKGIISLKVKDGSGGNETSIKAWQEKKVGISAYNSVPADSYLENGMIMFSIDEASDSLRVKVKYSSGTVKSGAIGLK